MTRILAFAAIVAWSGLAAAVDPLTVTESGGQVAVIAWEWTADAGGAATGKTSVVVPGVLYGCAVVPGTGGDQPTDNFDIVVKQAFTVLGGGETTLNVDLAGGHLQNRSNAGPTWRGFWPDDVYPLQGKIVIEVSNAGAGKRGRVELAVARYLALQISDVAVPLTGGGDGKVLQYKQPGQGKWVALSGEAVMADEGAVTLQGSPTFTAVTATTVNGTTVNATTVATTNANVGQDLYVGDDAQIQGNVDIGGALAVDSGLVDVGVDETVRGILNIYSYTQRGQLRLHPNGGSGYGIITSVGTAGVEIGGSEGSSVLVGSDTVQVGGTSVSGGGFIGGDVTSGRRGYVLLYRGTAGNAPGFVAMQSPNGTTWYLFVEDDGTLKVHSSNPTQNSDGTVVGSQS